MIDIIQRHFSDDTKDYSIAWGLDKDFKFYVYSIPDFVSIYKGPDEKHAKQVFEKYTKDFTGERVSFL